MTSMPANSTPAEEKYDYIVCGGGTSGCVIAARLAANSNVKILLLEAGPDSKDLENVHMPGGLFQVFGTENDWNIVTEPGKDIDNRRINATRGRFLGGSSGINGSLCIRGTRQDFDDWGMREWTGEKMFEYMKRVETFHEKAWHKSDPSVHGTDGPLHTEPHDLAPISERVKESMVDQGLPYYSDMFTTGKVSHGCGDTIRTVHQGIRTTAADFVTKKHLRNNITIKTEMIVDKILLSLETGEPMATGVVTISKAGERVEHRASKEVIISAGAYCSPLILMRSGLGPKVELEEYGIDCIVDLPGVGKNLQDHILTMTFYEVSEPGLTNDYLIHHDNAIVSSYQQYQAKNTGVLSTIPFGFFGFARLDDRLKDSELWKNAKRQPGRDPMGQTPQQPNMEFWNSELYGGPKEFGDIPTDHKHVFGIFTILFNSKSRGHVTLKSRDPFQNPIVDHNYLGDPLDVLVMTEACQFVNEIVVNGQGTKNIIKGSWPANLMHHTYTKREQWEPYVRQNVTTCYHPGGTCAMGKPDDPNAVLDGRLRVRGVRNLRVADMSSAPLLNSGHTQMVAYGLGEGAAELIKEDASGL